MRMPTPPTSATATPASVLVRALAPPHQRAVPDNAGDWGGCLRGAPACRVTQEMIYRKELSQVIAHGVCPRCEEKMAWRFKCGPCSLPPVAHCSHHLRLHRGQLGGGGRGPQCSGAGSAAARQRVGVRPTAAHCRGAATSKATRTAGAPASSHARTRRAARMEQRELGVD
jgi:hypothetical protein